MSIALLAVHHGGGIGGAPISLLKLLQRLDRSAFEPAAIFTQPGDVLGYAHDLGVPARVAPSEGAFFYSAHARLEPRTMARFIRTFPMAVRTARQTIRRERPDVLHLNTSVLVAWAAAARRERLPVVWVVREVLGANPWLRRWHANFILSHARKIVVTSDAVRHCLPPSAAVERVYNAVDLAEFCIVHPDRVAAIRADLNIPVEYPIVMAIGTVQRVKGHWMLLEALGRMSEPAQLVMVAGGVDAAYATTLKGRVKRALDLPLDNLEALLRDATRLGLRRRVHVTGFRRDVGRVMSAADVVAFPSLAAEGFGRPIIEAMAVARPVVATDVGPSAELLGPHAGRLVEPEAASVADALDDLLRAPDLRARMGQAGRRRVEQCFSLERQVAEMSRVYREAAGAR